MRNFNAKVAVICACAAVILLAGLSLHEDYSKRDALRRYGVGVALSRGLDGRADFGVELEVALVYAHDRLSFSWDDSGKILEIISVYGYDNQIWIKNSGEFISILDEIFNKTPRSGFIRHHVCDFLKDKMRKKFEGKNMDWFEKLHYDHFSDYLTAKDVCRR